MLRGAGVEGVVLRGGGKGGAEGGRKGERGLTEQV